MSLFRYQEQVISVRQHLVACVVVAIVNLAPVLPTFAQYSGGQESQTLRTPLIQGAPWSEANEPPAVGDPPPVGSGMSPLPVTPGHSGMPGKPPSAFDLPATGAMDKNIVNEMLAPYLQPPPSTLGDNPGMIAGSPGFEPPAALVYINPQGGIPGNAPIKHWGGQTTHDLGLPRINGSQTVDFGQNIDKLPSVVAHGIKRSVSCDGPRPAIYPGRFGADTNRQTNLPGANYTQNPHGNRQLFKGANLRALMTIADY